MTGASENFYGQLVPFKRFAEIANPKHYRLVPDDWWVVITDIKGSTEALANNRYKDINLLGASSIIAVINVLKGREIPFIFGGDGATLLIHDRDIEQIKPALRGTQKLARDVLGFELRVGVVPVRLISEHGYRVEVAKYAISSKSTIAAVRGGGLTYAEKLVKSHEEKSFRLTQDDGGAVDVSNFEGLSCRWNPIRAERGEMLSLLVMALDSAKAEETYQRVISKIEAILSEDDSRPVAPDKLDRRINLKTLFKEARTKSIDQSLWKKQRRFWSILFEEIVLHSFLRFGWKNARFDARVYVREMVENTDFQKFDDMIRMVRDCTSQQRDRLLQVLAEERSGGHIAYGVHVSREALMTCLVFQLDNHIHFVDGNGGGYAMAARQLKEQLKESTAKKTT